MSVLLHFLLLCACITSSAQRKHMRARGRDGKHRHPSRDAEMMTNYSQTCKLEELFCKVPSSGCANSQTMPPKCTKKLFITGTAGSGTHFVAHFLSKISAQKIKVKHESPATSPDVLVSWPSRCPASGNSRNVPQLDFKALGFTDPKLLKQPMVSWANMQISGQCKYTDVIHLVRHPLRYLSSNFAFGQCVGEV